MTNIQQFPAAGPDPAPLTPAARLGASPAAAAIGEIDIRHLFRILWRRKSLLIGTMLFVTALATLTVFQLTPRYTASAHVLINVPQSQVIDLEAVVAGAPADAEATQNEVQILRSRTLAAKVIEQVRLDQHPEFNPALDPPGGFADSLLNPLNWLPPEWLAAMGLGAAEEDPIDPEAQQVRVIDAYLDALVVQPEGRSRVIRIAFESENPDLAARVANAVADLYLVDQLEAKLEATQRATYWLNDRLSELRQSVETAEAAVEAYRAKTGLVEGANASVVAQAITELNAELVVSRSEQARADARLAQIQLLRSNGTIDTASEVLASPVVQNLRRDESTLLSQKAELASRFGPRHPEMIKLDAEIANIRTQIGAEVDRIVQGLANEAEIAASRTRALEEQFARLEAQATERNADEVQLRQLQREADASRALFETFLSRFKETSQQQGLEEPDGRLISGADVPSEASFPNKKLIIAVAFVFSACCGLMLVFLVEQLDSGFRSADQIETMLGVATLGLVPALAVRRGRAATTPESYIMEKPTSAFAEAIRSIRTSILLSNVDAPPKSILVTSSLPGEGKTAISLSLARSATMSGERVILLDCDLRRPRVHHALGVANEAGLVELLSQSGTLDQVLRKDERSDLHFITAGRFTANSAELLRSRQMQRLLRSLSEFYDLVVIDSPPVLPVADARILSTVVDKTLFVVRWNDVRRESVANAVKQLSEGRPNLAGAILNSVDVRKHARYGYSDSGYYYGRYRKYYAD